MGAMDFYIAARGHTPKQAFQSARQAALHEHGHGGYTGTIAEKQAFEILDTAPLSRAEAIELAVALLDADDERFRKGGPAGAIRLDREGVWLFFGLAPW